MLVGRRSRAEIERLVALYGSSGMGRIEFCRSQGLALSTLGRHLKKQRSKYSDSRSKGVGRSGLVEVEVAASVVSNAVSEVSATPIVLSIHGRRMEVSRGFDAETLTQLVTVLERM